MKHQIAGERGHLMDKMDGTLAQPLDGYRPTEHTHGLWKHKTRPVWFSLVVDDFGMTYIGCNNAKHFITSIKKKYVISSDWTGNAYSGLKLDWDYANDTIYLSMPVSWIHQGSFTQVPKTGTHTS
jgi:hypothetical protein